MNRLRSWDEFEKVMREGEIASRSHYFVLHLIAAEKFKSRVNSDANASVAKGYHSASLQAAGALVPKRWAKRAVTRNTLKRLIYAHLEKNESAWANEQIAVVRLKKQIAKTEFISATSPYLKMVIKADLVELFKRVKTS
jgi:ribonuclease P protein component